MRLSPLSLVLPVLTLAALPAGAEETRSGEELFATYCATCHGTAGQGDGPMTDLLRIAVPDLTGLSARNDGTYPLRDVVHVIDGRNALKGHGGPMPTFGLFLSGESTAVETADGETVVSRTPIMDLARYIETLQPE